MLMLSIGVDLFQCVNDSSYPVCILFGSTFAIVLLRSSLFSHLLNLNWKCDFQDGAKTLRRAVKWLLRILTLQAPAVGFWESLKQSPSLFSSL